MPDNLTSKLIEELGTAIRTINGTGDFTLDFSDANKMFYQMDRADFERIPAASFPRILILLNDLSAPEMLSTFNKLNCQVNIVLQFKQSASYNPSLSDSKQLLNAAYDVRRGVRAWQAGIQAGTYTANWEIINELTHEIGRNEKLITINTFFTVETEEEF